MITFENKKGFTLIEVMVVTVVLVVGLLGILGMLVYSIRAGATSQNRAVATYLAQEGLEAVRNIRDTNVFTLGADLWDDDFYHNDDKRYYIVNFNFSNDEPWSFPISGNTALDENSPQAVYRLYFDEAQNGYWNQFYPSSSYEPTQFYREISTDRVSSEGKYIVVSKILWIDQYGTHTIKMQEDLYNWF